MASVRPRRTQEERSFQTRQKLAQAGFELVRDLGFASFRVATVAKAAGVSQGCLLHHFPVKDAMAMACIEHAIAVARQRTTSNLESYAADQDVVAAITADSRDYYFSASFDVAMDVAKSVSGNPDLQGEIAAAHVQYRAYAEDGWLEILVAQGWPADEGRDLIAMTTSLVRGFAVRSMIQPDDKTVDRLMGRWRDIAHQSFAGKRD